MSKMREIEQESIDRIFEQIEEDIAEAKRMRRKPYTADDEKQYEKLSNCLEFKSYVVFTLCMIGITEAAKYRQALVECGNELSSWRWAK